MEVLSLSVITKYVLPHLSVGARGKTASIPTAAIVQAILYRVKTGCQWRCLPLKEFFTPGAYSWQSVYHHYRAWGTDESWRSAFVQLVKQFRHCIDMSCSHLDGTHTPAKRGGEAVGYQGRKRCMTSNTVVLVDAQGLPLGCASPQEGQHHDTFDIDTAMREIAQMLEEANLSLDGIFLNADAAFDTQATRSICAELGIEANIPPSIHVAATLTVMSTLMTNSTPFVSSLNEPLLGWMASKASSCATSAKNLIG